MMAAEVDCIHWQLMGMLDASKKRTPIENLIDEAVGWDKEQLKVAKSLIKRARFLRAKLEKAV